MKVSVFSAHRVSAVLTGLSLVVTAAVLAGLSLPAAAQQLRQLVNVEGIRGNQLIGYGLVVGLEGSGDSSQVKFSGQSVENMLKQFGLTLPARSNTRVRNVAAVMVSASLPAGYRRGQNIDVTVSSLGNAKSLRGGTLLLTQLKAANGEVYALAQGSVVISGVMAQGRSGSSVTINTPTSGRIPNGASIEQEIPSDFEQGEVIHLSLRRPNFETASNIVKTINRSYGNLASTRDATTIDVQAPLNPTERVDFVARLEKLDVGVGSELPRVVFNSRTGTVVISQGVVVHPAAVSHGNLRVVISEAPSASQPNPFGQGQTRVLPNSSVTVEQGAAQMFQWPAGRSLQTIVDAINRIGATPDDVMAILQALDQAGAIEGELVVI